MAKSRKKGTKRGRAAPPGRAASAQGPPIVKRPLILVASVVALLALLVYARSLNNGFVWDDPVILERQLNVFDSVGDVLITPRGIPQYSPDYYRPTTTATYLFDRWLGGSDPFVFHLSVVLTHALTSFLVVLYCAQLMAAAGLTGWFGPLTAGALFAVHPIHSESVCWAAGRSDVLATFFTLASLLLLGRRRVRVWVIVVSGLCALLGAGAKEVALALYLLVALRAYLQPDQSALGVRRYAGIAVALVVYVVLRTWSIGEVIGSQEGESAPLSVLMPMLWAIGAYVGKLLWPFPLNAYIDVIPRGPIPLLGVVALALAVVAALRAWKRDEWVWLYGLSWIPLCLAPSLSILWKIPEVPMAERYLYMPSVGLCVLAGLLAARIKRERIVAGVLFLVVILSSYAIWQRSPVWLDDLRLWSDTTEKTRVSGMAWRSLGSAYLRRGRDAEAAPALERALAMHNPPIGLYGIYSNLGTIELNQRRFAKARTYYAKALVLNPGSADLLFNLGLSIYYGGGQSAEAARRALPHLVQAGKLSPHDADIDAILGQVHLTLGDRDTARRLLRRALRRGLRVEMRSGIEQLLSTIE